jgi:hypothetical protein
LGSAVQENGSSDLETEKRNDETRKAISIQNSVLSNVKKLYSTKLSIYNSIVKSALTHRAEACSIKWKHRHKL